MPLATIDRYIARRMIAPLLALSGITLALLSLENLPRLLKLVEGVERPLTVLGRFMIALIPEYVAFGLVFGSFFATALTLRSMALASELDACWAAGISPVRLMRVPMLVALLLSLAHVGIRGFAEPWSEQRLDRIGQQARTGDFGLSLRAGELRHLSADITFLADQVERDTGRLGDVFVQAPGVTMTARFARLRNGGGRGLLLMLEDGVMLRDRRSMRFHMLNIPLRGPAAGVARRSMTDRADRATIPTLIDVAEGRSIIDGMTRRAAAGALAQRLSQAGLTLLAPWLALTLAIPPRRAPSGIGLGIGTLLLAGLVETGNALAASAPVAQAALFAGFAILIGGLSLWQRRAGYDVVERQLNGLALRFQRRPVPRESDAGHRSTRQATRLDLAA